MNRRWRTSRAIAAGAALSALAVAATACSSSGSSPGASGTASPASSSATSAAAAPDDNSLLSAAMKPGTWNGPKTSPAPAKGKRLFILESIGAGTSITGKRAAWASSVRSSAPGDS